LAAMKAPTAIQTASAHGPAYTASAVTAAQATPLRP